MELLTVRTFDSAIEAHMVRSRFACEGIMSFVIDEHIMTINPLYNIMVGGVKLKVAEVDVGRAQEILRYLDERPARDVKDHVILCPVCQSNQLYYGFKSMKGLAGVLSAALSLFLGTLPIYYKTLYRCKVCQTEFQKD